MSALTLFADPRPTTPDGIEIILGDAMKAIDLAEQLGGATLIIADPPWSEYEQEAGDADPSAAYPVLSLDEIRRHIDASLGAARPNARLAMWACWPLLPHALSVGPSRRGWRYITGGAWHKAEHQGVGFHWLGRSEPVLVWGRGSPPIDRSADLGNGWTSTPGQHSAKPEAWHAAWLRRWTREGDLVLDLYCGLGGVARACQQEGRRYVGAELDPRRHAAAVSFTAQRRERA